MLRAFVGGTSTFGKLKNHSSKNTSALPCWPRSRDGNRFMRFMQNLDWNLTQVEAGLEPWRLERSDLAVVEQDSRHCTIFKCFLLSVDSLFCSCCLRLRYGTDLADCQSGRAKVFKAGRVRWRLERKFDPRYFLRQLVG